MAAVAISISKMSILTMDRQPQRRYIGHVLRFHLRSASFHYGGINE
jgi:hypothetical protein